MSGPIVVGVDGTEGSGAALREAIDLARALHVPVVAAFGYDASPIGGEVADLAAVLRERGEAVTADALEELRAVGIEATAEVIAGRPAESLARLADERDARMIVVGSHGDSALRGALIGSTPHRLLHVTSRPVLVVRG